MTFTSWRQGEPNNAGSNQNEDCILLSTGTSPEWIDHGCNQHHYGYVIYRPLCKQNLWFTETIKNEGN